MRKSLPAACQILFVAIASAFMFNTASAEPRTWTDSTGKFNIEAEFAGIIAGDVRLKKPDGSAVSVPLDRLSDADQDWVKKEIEREKPRLRAVSKEEQAEMEGAKEEALQTEMAVAEEKKRQADEETWLREGYKLPKDIKTLYTFEVEGGEFSVALSTPVSYWTGRDSSVGANVLHAFWDGKAIDNGAAGFYTANGKTHKVWYDRTEPKSGVKWWRPVLFGDHQFNIEYVRLQRPVETGMHVESVLQRIGDPDQKKSLSLGSQVWTYDRFPYLEIWIRDGRVSYLSAGPADGERALRKWIDEHQAEYDDDAEIDLLFAKYLKNGYKVPGDWKSFHVFEVSGGLLAVATTSPINYGRGSSDPVGGEICHAFWDGKTIQDYTSGYYEVDGQRLVVRSSPRPERKVGGIGEYTLEFSGRTFTIPVFMLITPATQGQSAESVRETLGEPDTKLTSDDGIEKWYYEKFPFLEISVQADAVTNLKASPQPGLVKLLTWMAERGYDLESD